MGNGTGLVTKGLIGAEGAVPVVDRTVRPSTTPSDAITIDPRLLRGDISVVVPSALNIVLMVSENITANLRVGKPSSFVLPSLFRRAQLIAHETEEIIVFRERK